MNPVGGVVSPGRARLGAGYPVAASASDLGVPACSSRSGQAVLRREL